MEELKLIRWKKLPLITHIFDMNEIYQEEKGDSDTIILFYSPEGLVIFDDGFYIGIYHNFYEMENFTIELGIFNGKYNIHTTQESIHKNQIKDYLLKFYDEDTVMAILNKIMEISLKGAWE